MESTRSGSTATAGSSSEDERRDDNYNMNGDDGGDHNHQEDFFQNDDQAPASNFTMADMGVGGWPTDELGNPLLLPFSSVPVQNEVPAPLSLGSTSSAPSPFVTVEDSSTSLGSIKIATTFSCAADDLNNPVSDDGTTLTTIEAQPIDDGDAAADTQIVSRPAEVEEIDLTGDSDTEPEPLQRHHCEGTTAEWYQQDQSTSISIPVAENGEVIPNYNNEPLLWREGNSFLPEDVEQNKVDSATSVPVSDVNDHACVTAAAATFPLPIPIPSFSGNSYVEQSDVMMNDAGGNVTESIQEGPQIAAAQVVVRAFNHEETPFNPPFGLDTTGVARVHMYLNKISEVSDVLYRQFLDVMRQFRANRLDLATVYGVLSHLFRDHPDLISGLNTLLSPEERMSLNLPPPVESSGYSFSTGYNGVCPSLPPPPVPVPVPFINSPAGNSTFSILPTPVVADYQGLPYYVPPPLPLTPPGYHQHFVQGLSPYQNLSTSYSPSWPVAFPSPSPPSSSSIPFYTPQPTTDPTTTLPYCNQDERALSLASKIKRCLDFRGGKMSFVDIVEAHKRNGVVDTEQLYKTMSTVLENDKDTLREFREYLPLTNDKNDQEMGQPKKKIKKSSSVGGTSGGLGKKKKQLTKKAQLSQYNKKNETVSPHVEEGQSTTVTVTECAEHNRANGKVSNFLKSASTSSSSLYPLSLGKTRTKIGVSDCMKYGTSYYILPKNVVLSKCSGRTELDRQVLNDTFVSAPSIGRGKNSTTRQKHKIPTPKVKKQRSKEDIQDRYEDDRFELDRVIDSNTSTIRTLESAMKRMRFMTDEELKRFTLDDLFDASIFNIRSIERVYGKGEAADLIVEGLKRAPHVIVPRVLGRLQAKDEEWNETKKAFNKMVNDKLDRL